MTSAVHLHGPQALDELRGPAHAAHREKPVRNRFSIAKMRGFIAYSRATSQWRQSVVVLLFAVPSVLVCSLSSLIPLQDPARGYAANHGYFLHAIVTFTVIYVGSMIQVRAATAISHEFYANADIVAIAVIAALALFSVFSIVSTYWRFPVPFSWVIFISPWMISLVFGHAVVLRHRLAIIRRPLLAYMPSFTVQISQVVVYPVYSAVFEAADTSSRIVLILLFPVLKVALKKSVFALTRRANSEFSSEIAVSGVEICSSMYQAMIMQVTPSLFATALVIGIDLLHGLVAIQRFIKRSANTDVPAVLTRVLENNLSIQGTKEEDDRNLSRFETRTAMIWPDRAVEKKGLAGPSLPPLGDPTGRDHDKRSLTQTLELLQSAETILLVEYLEVAVPLINAIYLPFATQCASAIYNPRLRPFVGHPAALGAAMANLVLYTSLQTMTLVAMAVAMQYRLKLSALTLLAFVLESHWWSLQGKMVSWLGVLFVFSVVHYGVDFTFQFDFAVPPMS